jgi:hypothetical protein
MLTMEFEEENQKIIQENTTSKALDPGSAYSKEF